MDENPSQPPLSVRLVTLPDVACPYLPGRVETVRAVMASSIDGQTYHAFMDAGFRRSGRMIYQPVCRDCRECRTIRLRVGEFRPTQSQRRCRNKNADLVVSVGPPVLTDEKLEVYVRYVRDWHGKAEPTDRTSVEQFLYDSPTETIEFTYRDPAGRLVAVGICDVSRLSLSSVYFYFDPADAGRGLGTFGAVREIEWAVANGIAFYYLGYYVRDCPAMRYKAHFGPAELLDASGQWQRL